MLPCKSSLANHAKTPSFRFSQASYSDTSSICMAGRHSASARMLRTWSKRASGCVGAASPKTRDAYAKDWRHITSWCRRTGFDPLPRIPTPSGSTSAPVPQAEPRALPQAAAIQRRRPCTLGRDDRTHGCPASPGNQRRLSMDRADRHIATVLAGLRRKRAKPPRQKEAVLGEDLLAMIDTLGHDLRACATRHSAARLRWRRSTRRPSRWRAQRRRRLNRDFPGQGRTGVAARQYRLGARLRSTAGPATPPAPWLRWRPRSNSAALGEARFPPYFSRRDRRCRRLSDKHVARLVKQTALPGGVRADLPEAEPALLFAGHSRRAGLASSATSRRAVCKSSSVTHPRR